MPSEHHDRNIAGFGVSDAQAVDELTGLAELLERDGEMDATAVNKSDQMPILHKAGNRAAAPRQQRLVLQARAANLHNDLHASASCSRQPYMRFMFCTA